jgi:hypothetical protein
MKNLFKKWYFWVILVVIVGAIAIFGGGSDDSTGTDASNTTTAAAVTTVVDNTIDDYECIIKTAELGSKTYDNKPTVVITYTFTNNSDEPAAFYTAFTDTVYQDGIECERSYNLDETNEDKNIKPGSSIDVKLAYVLNDTTTNIDVEVGGFWSLDGNVITKSFQLG